METIFMNMKNSKTNEPHKFVLNLSQRLDYRSYYPRKKITRWFLLRVRYSGLYRIYCKKKHETLTTVLTIHVYINRTNNRLVFQTEKGYKLELKMPEAMKLFRSTNKLMDKRKTEKREPGLEVVEVVLLECNLVNNHYLQKSEILYTFTPSKSYAYLLLAEPRSLVFLKTCNTEIILTFTDKNSRPLKVEHKFNLTLFINR